MRAWIGLGGNRGDSAVLLGKALKQLSEAENLRLLRSSRCYRTPPWGVTEQPDFVNAVAEFDTALQPLELLHLLLDVERRLGRDRAGPHWGPRCLDLDLLTYDQLRLTSDQLVLPHPRMHLRAFVLVPLLELEPGFVIPGLGPAVDWLNALDPEEIVAVVSQPPAAKEETT